MKKTEPKKQVVVRMPESLKRRLGEKASSEGQSLNATILLLIQKGLKGS
jgi:predicted HicB family RNase H-like nuclease